jgi:hypothetical protein
MSWLTRLLDLNSEANDQVAEGAEKLKTATEFLGEAAERLADPLSGSLADIVENALPWVGDIADAVGDAVPPVKAILKIVGLLARETDARVLGLLAFSLAYQAAVAEAVKAIEHDPSLCAQISNHVSPRAVRQTINAKSDHDSPEDFDGFRLQSALAHKLAKRADLALQQVAEAAGYSEALRRDLVQRVHRRLVDQMRAIISDGRVKEKFDPLVRFMSMDSRTYSTHDAIDRHIRYQLWRFNHAPALGREGTMSVVCPLREIFVPLDCGVMTWGK